MRVGKQIFKQSNWTAFAPPTKTRADPLICGLIDRSEEMVSLAEHINFGHGGTRDGRQMKQMFPPLKGRTTCEKRDRSPKMGPSSTTVFGVHTNTIAIHYSGRFFPVAKHTAARMIFFTVWTSCSSLGAKTMIQLGGASQPTGNRMPQAFWITSLASRFERYTWSELSLG